MEVLAVSAALPSWHTIKEEQTLTSIVRQPLKSGFIDLTANGIEDNDTAIHEGPVYIQFAHHYDYWCEQLNVDRKEWDWCHWGENITFKCDDTNLNEHSFHLGDIWQVGQIVRLRVCGSRIPCFKLAWRCGQKDSWLKPLADSGFCGVYFDVVRPGRLSAGDRAQLIQERTDTIDCASITRAAFDGSLKSRDTANLLANNELLLNMLRLVFGRKALIMEDAARQGKNAWKGWRKFRPFKIVDEGGSIMSFHLKPLDGEPLATYLPGQFLSVRLPSGDVRSWSISDWSQDPDAPDSYRISIKRAQNASLWMAKKCTINTVLEVRSPAGIFALDTMPMFLPQQVYLSAGVGITPIFAMIKAHRAHRAMSQTPAIWIHVARNGNEVPFKQEMDQLPRTFKRFWCFTKPLENEIEGVDYEKVGRPDKELLKSLLSPGYEIHVSRKSLSFPGQKSNFYICGPASFEQGMRTLLSELGVPAPLIKSENFSSDGAAELPDLEEAMVHFTKSNVRAKWEKNEPVSILELAEKVGLAPDYGCRVGVCGSCSSKLKCGTVAGGLQPDGSVYICQARPAGPKLEIEI